MFLIRVKLYSIGVKNVEICTSRRSRQKKERDPRTERTAESQAEMYKTGYDRNTGEKNFMTQKFSRDKFGLKIHMQKNLVQLRDYFTCAGITGWIKRDAHLSRGRIKRTHCNTSDRIFTTVTWWHHFCYSILGKSTVPFGFGYRSRSFARWKRNGLGKCWNIGNKSGRNT